MALRRSSKLELKRRLNMEEQATSKDLANFAQPSSLPPGVSMLPLPQQSLDLAPAGEQAKDSKVVSKADPGQWLF